MYLEVQHISKAFTKEQVLFDLSFSLEKGKMLSILGKSGCGKTTLLKILAGLESPDQGRIFLDGRDQGRIPVHQRQIVYLYQEALLFPHLNIFENIAFGLRLQKLPEKEIQQRTNNLLEELELKEMGLKRPDQLSGGQKQRVAFGRAIAINPRVLLLDEPFGALDQETRQTMQVLLKKIAATHQITAVFVTHDLREAIIMGDALAILKRGRLKVFPNRKSFLEDQESGVREEINFWQSLDDSQT